MLLATASPGQRRPTLAESCDLLRGAARMRLGLSRSPWTVLYAVRLMYLGALAELATMVTLLVTWPGIRATVLDANPVFRQHGNALSAMETARTADVIVLSVVTVAWLVLAWANGRGYEIARLAAVFGLLFNTLAVGTDLAGGVVRYAPAAVSASGITWAIGLAAVILIYWKQSWPYYARR